VQELLARRDPLNRRLSSCPDASGSWLPRRLTENDFAAIERKRMKKLYVLCLVTLLAVLVDLVLFHARTANAQNTGNYKIVQVNNNLGGRSFQLEGTVVGFSCVDSQGGQYWCYAVIKQ
jgi:hypothetical protein